MGEKIKIAIYWAGCCGGCDVALLDIDERILDVAALADIVFWPIAMDFKLKDVEALEDGEITITFYNGSIRNSENEHIAKLLRKKSKIVIAFGSCATHGGIIGMANVTTRDAIFKTVYQDTVSTVNPDFVVPQTELNVPEGKLTLPEILNTTITLDDIVDVDYFMPGCPPTTELIGKMLDAVAAHLNEGAPLPPKGTVIASDKTLCDECPREKSEDINIKKIYRVHEIVPDPDKCLLEQGIICCGPATRAGCGAKCIDANMPCRGCMGPTAAAIDQGGSMLSAISSILDFTDREGERTEEEIEELMEQIVDPLGTFYRFSLPKALIRRTVKEAKVKTEGGV